MSSRLVETMDALYTVIVASVDSDVVVYKAPVITQEYPPKVIYVGFSGDSEGPVATASSRQTWAGLGAKRKSEYISIPSLVLVETGDDDPIATRDAAFAVLADIEDALIADPSMGMTPTVVVDALTEINYALEETSRGICAAIVFTLQATVRF